MSKLDIKEIQKKVFDEKTKKEELENQRKILEERLNKLLEIEEDSITNLTSDYNYDLRNEKSDIERLINKINNTLSIENDVDVIDRIVNTNFKDYVENVESNIYNKYKEESKLDVDDVEKSNELEENSKGKLDLDNMKKTHYQENRDYYMAQKEKRIEDSKEDVKKPKLDVDDVETSGIENSVLLQDIVNEAKTKIKNDFNISNKDNNTIFNHKSKDYKIVEENNKLVTRSNGNIDDKINSILDIADSKNWDLNSLNVKANAKFKQRFNELVKERLEQRQEIKIELSNELEENLVKDSIGNQKLDLTKEVNTINDVLNNTNFKDIFKDSANEVKEELEKLKWNLEGSNGKFITTLDDKNITSIKDSLNTLKDVKSGFETQLKEFQEKLKEKELVEVALKEQEQEQDNSNDLDR